MLPPLLALAPHRSLLPVGSRARRIGLCPEGGLVVDDLDPAVALMLDELTAPVRPGPLVERAVRRGADPDAAGALLGELVDAGAVVDPRPARRAAGRRGHAVALVVGDGPLAAGVVTGLVAAGVGTVHVQAGGTVTAADLGTGLVDADRGAARAVAIGGAAARLVPGTEVTPPPQRLLPDLVVLADAQAPPSGLTDRLVADGTAHLLVRLRDGVGVVGPLVLPGRTACLRCLDRWRTERDPGWPAVAAQLAGRRGHADPACTAATAALGTAQALAALDGSTAPPTLDTTIELDVGTASLVHRRWHPHPGCPCGGPRHPPTTCGRADVGGRLEA